MGLVAGDDDRLVGIIVRAEEAEVGQGAEPGGACRQDSCTSTPCRCRSTLRRCALQAQVHGGQTAFLATAVRPAAALLPAFFVRTSPGAAAALTEPWPTFA
ncbi:hypothetical protein ACIPSA_47120 [Streptomyces sp. NPDC086549]|uniref:hypothetical protein n=1 Tax=Streptomyces sp. NPDC086549 TaxID=3365752 RepID=UPI00380F05E3